MAAAAAMFGADAGSKPGLAAWRIEKLAAVKNTEAVKGELHGGDSYIFLQTVEEKGKRSWNIYFWLGAESSQDERGAAALLTVSLDDQLGGAPVQHREVQGHESAAFLALFPSGLQVLEGGVSSGFKHVDRDHYEPRLFQVKGSRDVRSTQVALSAESLNAGDVFVLDLGLKIYQWNGESANKMEKAKALDVTTHIRNSERGGKAEVVVLDQDKNDNDDAFWGPLGGRKAVKSAEAGGSDELPRIQPRLHRVSDASGQMSVTLAGEGRLERGLLDTNDVFILDVGSEIFVWVGKGANAAERKKAMEFGAQFLKDSGRPDYTPISRVNESGETPQFKAHFHQFDPPVVRDVSSPAAKAQTAADAHAMLGGARAAAEKMVDDASGKVEVWRIQNFDKAPVPPAQYGQFFAGDSYIVLYEYQQKSRTHWIIYFWQGRDSTADERGTSALLAKQMDDERNGEPVQVRVVQGKEPAHFVALFKGRMVVHLGGHASAFANRAETDTYDADSAALYHIKGTNPHDTRAVQVAAAAQSLNSGDCFVLLVPGNLYVWYGRGANDEERATAGRVAEALQAGRQVHQVPEGEEPEDFWSALGGRGEYPSTQTISSGAHQPRLFQLSNVSGTFRAEEIFSFDQDDLVQDDVMLLDTHDELFVWVGHSSNADERRLSLQTAFNYLKADGRGDETPVYQISAGQEPPNFTCHFLGWNDAKAADFSDPYQRKLAAAGAKVGAQPAAAGAAAGAAKPAPAAPVRVTANSAAVTGAFDYSQKRTVAELKAGFEGIDPANKQKYLSDADFQATFKMTPDAFDKLPEWKRKELKKAAGLF